MPEFKSLNDLFAHINKNIASTLQNEVAKVATEEMSEAVIDDVYNAYDPSQYERRGLDGGLADTRNMSVEIVNDNTISITNDTGENVAYGGDPYSPIDGIIVSGRGYTWRNSQIYHLQPFPRDFYAGTVARLKKNNRHVQAFKEGMRRRGIDVK